MNSSKVVVAAFLAGILLQIEGQNCGSWSCHLGYFCCKPHTATYWRCYSRRPSSKSYTCGEMLSRTNNGKTKPGPYKLSGIAIVGIAVGVSVIAIGFICYCAGLIKGRTRHGSQAVSTSTPIAWQRDEVPYDRCNVESAQQEEPIALQIIQPSAPPYSLVSLGPTRPDEGTSTTHSPK